MRPAPRPARRLVPWHWLLAALATAAGCALVALVQPSTPHPTTSPVVSRRAGLSSSSRGGTRLGEQPFLSGSLRAQSLGPATSTPLLLAADEVTPTATLEPPTPAAPTAEPPRTEIIIYKVQPGDNLRLIAGRFGIDPDTLVWANPEVEENPDLLRIDQELAILPVDGVLHTVKAGETLAAIAQRYQVTPEAIISYAANDITDPSVLKIGQQLIIPGGKKPAQPKPASSSRGATSPGVASGPCLAVPAGAPEATVEAPDQPGRFIKPTEGILTQGYWKWHGAIDLANRTGTPILAADAGTVTYAGGSPSCGLGYAVQINHGDGFVTSYAHLNSIAVQVGQQVQKGEVIGQMGSTGHSTGPHLHFIMQYNGGILDPFRYIPQ